jgi:DNA polymerase-3 subunit alpha
MAVSNSNNEKLFLKQFKKINLPLYGVRLPNFQIDLNLKRKHKLSEDCSNHDFLRALSLEGFESLGLKKNSDLYKKYIKRAKYELKVLKELEFTDYILLVWMVINFCKENKIAIGLGRGSAAGSLILFFIGVTKIDPIKYDLFFERFISKARTKKQVIDGVTYLDGSLMCDIDVDVCYYNRQTVIKYLEGLFSERTSKIVTFNTLSGKLVMKECGKIVGEKTEQEMNEVTSLIPRVFGIVKDLEEAYEEEPKFKDWCDENEESYKIALKLRGLIKNKSVHASAISLSYDKLEDCCPTELSSDKSSITSYDMNYVSISNVKLDILGLRSASVVDDACKKIGINAEDIDLNDPAIYQNLQDLKAPHGLFQIEADTNFRVCRKVKPKNLEQLSAVLALARPGALAYVNQYANYVNNETYDVIHPFFEDILASTGGVALYQEQLMKMAHKVGFTLDEAEILRRIVGKKKVSEVREWKKKIKNKVKENNLDKKISNVLWKVLEDSANYSFNKSHSISYAALAAITIYLKFKHPKEFYLSLLRMTRNEGDPIDEISKIHKELHQFDMKLLPPHILKSDLDFTIENKNIRFGLLSIKGISDKSIEKLQSFRKKYSNKFGVFQGAEEAKIGIGILSALLQAGALETEKQTRSRTVLEAQLWNILTFREKKIVVKYKEKFKENLLEILRHISKLNDEKGRPLIKDSRKETIRKRYKPYKEIYDINQKSEDLANWYYERTLLGFTYNKTLREIYADKRSDLMSVFEAQEAGLNEKITLAGTVIDYRTGKSRKGTRYYKAEVQDETGLITVLIFNDSVDDMKSQNGGRYPQKGSLVILRGTKKEDAIFAYNISVQDQKIYTKLSQLKSDKKENNA